MKRFRYHGSSSGVTIVIEDKGEKQTKELLLFDGMEIELPEDHPYVQTLIALGHLEEIEKTQAKRRVKEEV